MRALILGANGYLGRHLASAARAKAWDVSLSDIHSQSWNGNPDYRPCDLRKPLELFELDWNVDLVFVFGGLTGTTDTFDHYADQIDVNGKGFVGVLEAMRRTGSQAKVVYPSTRLVYKGSQACLLREDAEKGPRTVYAATKLAAESYLSLYQRMFGLRYTVFRICVPYGNLLGDEYSYGTTGVFLRYAKRGEAIPIFGNGEQRRTFSHIEDVCDQVIAGSILRESDGVALNVAGGDNLSIREAASMIAAHYGVSVQSTPWPEWAQRCESGDTVFDSSAIQRLTGHRCRHRLSSWVACLENNRLPGPGDGTQT